MIKIKPFTVTGTEKSQEDTIPLDEIVIHGTPETMRQISIFLINSAREMDINETDHFHLQDAIEKFSYEKHCDIILVNKNIIKKKQDK